MQELRRWREFLTIPLTLRPKFFPVNDELAATMVMALREHHMGEAIKFAGACLSAVWVEDRDISDRSTLLEIAKEQSIDSDSLLTRFEEMRSIRKLDSENAIQRGVFGAPTYITGKEVFWGQDRLELLECKLRS
jgi:2-hydroxychromene-2-carboxylate isomerase